jgi:hypothetical protein
VALGHFLELLQVDSWVALQAPLSVHFSGSMLCPLVSLADFYIVLVDRYYAKIVPLVGDGAILRSGSSDLRWLGGASH